MRSALVAATGLTMAMYTTAALAQGGGLQVSTDSGAQAATQPALVGATPAQPAPLATEATPHHGEGMHHGDDADHAKHHHGDKPHCDCEGGKDHLQAGADVVIGFGRKEVGLDRSVATSFLLAAKYHFEPWFNLGLRWPLIVGSLAGETGKTAVGNVGNVELGPEVELKLMHGLKLLIELGMALPTAGGDPYHPTDDGARQQAAMNEVASASRGGEEGALFVSQRFGLNPHVSLELERGPIEAGLNTKFELLFKSGGEDPAPVTGLERKSPAADWVTGAGVFWRAIPRHLSVGTRAWVSYALAEATVAQPLPTCSAGVTTNCAKPGEAVAAESKTQFVLEPGVKLRFHSLRSSLSYILPLGGPLGDRGYGGVRLGVGAVY